MYGADKPTLSFHELRNTFSDYIDAFDSIYKLSTVDEGELSNIYNNIKEVLIEKYKINISAILNIIEAEMHLHCRFINSYLYIIKLLAKDYPINADKIHFLEDYNTSVECFNPIFKSIINDDLIGFRRLFDETCDIRLNIKGFYSTYSLNILSFAALCGSEKCFKYIRSELNFQIKDDLNYALIGANPNIINECMVYETPSSSTMQYAVMSHNTDFIIYLMNNFNIKINMDDTKDYNNLEAFIIIMCESEDINKILLESPHFSIPLLCEIIINIGADIEYKTRTQTTLLNAVKANAFEVIKKLISLGANVNQTSDFGQSPLEYACHFNNTEIAEYLIDKGADIHFLSPVKENLVHTAARGNSVDIFKLLMNYGLDINATNEFGETPLHLAIWYNNIDAIMFLVKNGANINIQTCEQSPLHYAAQVKSELLEFLLNHGADPNSKNCHFESPLHSAVKSLFYEGFKILVSHGSFIDEKDLNGFSPLHHAVNMKDMKMVDVIIENGADINSTDSMKNTPLHLAAKNSCYEITKYLVEHHAYVNVKNENYETPLHFAVFNNDPKIIKLLIDAGAELSSKDDQGRTPLIIAINYKMKLAEEILIQNGADK